MMTPQEKWQRIRDPKCADDYGLDLTLDEMREVPELASLASLVALVEEVWREAEEKAEEYELLAAAAGKDVGEVIGKMAREILVKGIVPAS